MMLGYVSGLGRYHDETDLCVIAEKVDSVTVPVRVRDLVPQTAAVYRIGPEEAVTVTYDEESGGKIIAAVASGVFYLTPNLIQSPGLRTRRVKIWLEGDMYRTMYDRERGRWEEWVANRERE